MFINLHLFTLQSTNASETLMNPVNIITIATLSKKIKFKIVNKEFLWFLVD